MSRSEATCSNFDHSPEPVYVGQKSHNVFGQQKETKPDHNPLIMATIWQSNINDGKLATFSDELEKGGPSKGSFNEDYLALCAIHEVTSCPFIVSSGEESNICRIANATVDLASWRAALLAASVEGSKITEIAVHACEITPQHVSDIVATIEKIGSIAVLKMEYITLRAVEGDAAEEGKEDATLDGYGSFLPLLKGVAEIGYLSLKGNNLQALCSSADFYTAICENLTLKCLSLSNCKLDDVACSQVIEGMRQASCVRELSLSQNLCTGKCLSALQGVLVGAEVSAENDARFKNLAKLIGDKNKAIKDVNKGRKKKGLPDLAELVPPVERIEAGFMSNRTIRVVDMSFCPLNAACVQEFIAALRNPEMHKAQMATPLKATLIVRGGAWAVAGTEVESMEDTEITEPVPLLEGLTLIV